MSKVSFTLGRVSRIDFDGGKLVELRKDPAVSGDAREAIAKSFCHSGARARLLLDAATDAAVQRCASVGVQR